MIEKFLFSCKPGNINECIYFISKLILMYESRFAEATDNIEFII
jgi:hypothetical protein